MKMYAEEYKGSDLCERCGTKLTGKQGRWCSINCSRLGLKREWKKRNPEAVKKHKRAYGQKLDHKFAKVLKDGKRCYRCKKKTNLEVHHIKPTSQGGTHDEENLMILCHGCHVRWEKRMKGYWIL